LNEDAEADQAVGYATGEPFADECIEGFDAGELEEVAWAALDHGYMACTILVLGGEHSYGCGTAADYEDLFVGVVEVDGPELGMDYGAFEVLEARDFGLESLVEETWLAR
jgi:hypothetical protein